MWLSLLFACRPPTELNPVTLAGTGYILEQATFDLESLMLEECENGRQVQTLLFRRFSLTGPGPIQVPDRPWCSYTLTFREGGRGVWLSGRIRREEGTPLRFSYQIAPEKLTEKQSFYGDGYELALVLDPDILIQPQLLLALSEEEDPPLDVVSFGISSPESVALSTRLPEALWVGNLPEAERKYGLRWPFAPPAFHRQTDVYVASGCAAEGTRPWDTSVYQGSLDTGEPPESRPDSPTESSPAESIPQESSPIYHEYPENTGCGGGSGPADTSEPSDTFTSADDTSGGGNDTSDSGGSADGCDCGGGGGDSDSPTDSRAGLLLGFAAFWRLRRKRLQKPLSTEGAKRYVPG